MTTNYRIIKDVIGAIDRNNPRGLRPGSFTTALIQPWTVADTSNSAKLASAFPEYAEVIDVFYKKGMNGLEEILDNANREKKQ